MAKKTTTYLLALEGPLYTVPLKMFDSIEDVMEWVGENPAVKPGDSDSIGDKPYQLIEAWLKYGADPVDMKLLFTAGRDENYAPLGYSLFRFFAGEPNGYALLEPYTNREPAYPGDGPKPFDREQKLEWSNE